MLAARHLIECSLILMLIEFEQMNLSLPAKREMKIIFHLASIITLKTQLEIHESYFHGTKKQQLTAHF